MYIYIYIYIYVYIYIIFFSFSWLATWAATKQACRDKLVVYLSFSSHNIYIALLLCIKHCFTKVKILRFVYVYIKYTL